jgi:hypothetical protein
MDYFQVGIPVLGLALNVLSHIVIVRWRRQRSLLRAVILGFLLGGLMVVILEGGLFFSLRIDRPAMGWNTLTNLLIYVILSYGYFHFVNLGETARRIRILREIAEAPTGLSVAELLTRYNARQIVEIRLRRLLQNGQICVQADRYIIGKPVMLSMAYTIVWLKRLMLGKSSEFEEKQ